MTDLNKYKKKGTNLHRVACSRSGRQPCDLDGAGLNKKFNDECRKHLECYMQETDLIKETNYTVTQQVGQASGAAPGGMGNGNGNWL